MNLRSKVQPKPQLHKLASYRCFTYHSIAQTTVRPHQLSSSGRYSDIEVGVNARVGQGQAHVIQEVTNCVVIKNQSPYSLTDLEPPSCERFNDVGINSLGCPLQEIRVFLMYSPIR